jgi:hypothetical protein
VGHEATLHEHHVRMAAMATSLDAERRRAERLRTRLKQLGEEEGSEGGGEGGSEGGEKAAARPTDRLKGA